MSVSTTAARLEKCKQQVIDELGKSAEQLSYGLGFIGHLPDDPYARLSTSRIEVKTIMKRYRVEPFNSPSGLTLGEGMLWDDERNHALWVDIPERLYF